MDPPNCVLKSPCYSPATYKTKRCDSYEQNGRCAYKFKCLYAHGEHELRIGSSPRCQICLPVAKPCRKDSDVAALPAKCWIMPPLPLAPPLPPPPLPPPPLQPKPLPPLPPPQRPYANLVQLAHLPRSGPLPPSVVKTIEELHKSIMPKKDPHSEWASLLKTIQELHETIMPKSCFSEDSCVVCLSNVPTHVFKPCNHFVVCEICAPKYEKMEVKKNGCYQCRQTADLVMFAST